MLVAKYADHLPLYRQSDIYAREGVDLERSTLADWVGRSAALLKAKRLERHIGFADGIGLTSLFRDQAQQTLISPTELIPELDHQK